MIPSLKDAIKAKLLAMYTRQFNRYKQRISIDNHSDLCMPVGFLYTVEVKNPEKTEAVLRAVEKIKASGKKVQVLCYLPTKDMESSKHFASFTKNDINFLGNSKKKELTNFLKTRFEHLYHIDLISEPILDYIMATCGAKCRIGNFIVGRGHVFEILFKGLVETDQKITFDSLISKMLNYTQLLQV